MNARQERPWQDADRLRELYHGKGLSQIEVAEELGCSRETVLAWMEKLDIEARDPNDSRYFETQQRLRDSEDEIVDAYESGEPMYAIAEDYDVNDATVRRFLESVGAETRGISGQLEMSFSTDRAESLDVDIPSELRDPDTLREMYWGGGKSTREIGRELGCAGGTVGRWLMKHGIDIRDRSEAVRLSKNGLPSLRTGPGGYEYIRHAGENVRHHRLLATLLVDDISELDGQHVHHVNHIEWANWLENFDVLDFKSHMSEHGRY